MAPLLEEAIVTTAAEPIAIPPYHSPAYHGGQALAREDTIERGWDFAIW